MVRPRSAMVRPQNAMVRPRSAMVRPRSAMVRPRSAMVRHCPSMKHIFLIFVFVFCWKRIFYFFAICFCCFWMVWAEIAPIHTKPRLPGELQLWDAHSSQNLTHKHSFMDGWPQTQRFSQDASVELQGADGWKLRRASLVWCFAFCHLGRCLKPSMINDCAWCTVKW